MAVLPPEECAALARRAVALIDAAALPPDTSVVLWADEDTVAWLEARSRRRDTGYHDHDGSAVGVYVITGNVTNEGLPLGGSRRVRHYVAGDSFSFPGTGIHRMEHGAGAVTVHVYSPPLRAIGYYEIVDGLLQRIPGPPDEPSPESPRLLAALSGEDPGHLDQDAIPVGPGLLSEPGQRAAEAGQSRSTSAPPCTPAIR